MKKKLALLLMLAMLLAPAALAVTQEQAFQLAIDAVGGDAEVMQFEWDDGVFEIDLRSANAYHQVDVLDATGGVVQAETIYTNASRASTFTLTPEEALQAAQAVAPEAANGVAIAERDDGACVYEVFYSTDSMVGMISVNAETGAINRLETYPEAVARGIKAAPEIVQLVNSRQAGVEIVELELGWDDGAYQYEGEVNLNGMRYSFTLDAVTGNFFEWERD